MTAPATWPRKLSHAVMENPLWQESAANPAPGVTTENAGRAPAAASVTIWPVAAFAGWEYRHSATEGQIAQSYPPAACVHVSSPVPPAASLVHCPVYSLHDSPALVSSSMMVGSYAMGVGSNAPPLGSGLPLRVKDGSGMQEGTIVPVPACGVTASLS